MSQFCKKHREEMIGSIEQLMKVHELNRKEAELLDTAWACEPSGLCEECGAQD